MNILDELSVKLSGTVYRGFIPPVPDSITAIFEYDTGLTTNSFCGTHIVQGVQVRTRAKTAAAAYSAAQLAQIALNRYTSADYTVLQTSSILDIGRDDKQRQEYTINFVVRRLK